MSVVDLSPLDNPPESNLLWRVLVVTAFLDAVLTDTALSMGYHELNPIMRFFYHSTGVTGLFLAKFMFLVGAYIAWWVSAPEGRTRVLIAAVVIEALVVVNTIVGVFLI